MKEKAPRFLLAAGFLFFAILLAVTEPPLHLALLAASVSLHETGHLLVLRLAGIPVRRLSLLPVGFRLERDGVLCGYGTEALVYLAGPAVSLLSAALTLPHCSGDAEGAAFLFFFLSAGNGLFNLIPLPGTDGCGALRCFLCVLCRSEAGARRGLSVVTLGLATVFFSGAALHWIRCGTGLYPLCAAVYFLLSGIAERCKE